MPTLVGDLIEEIQDRIPEEKIQMLFPILNRAISIISNRLYLMESDLVKGDLSVKAFVERAYTADTISFTDGGAASYSVIEDNDDGFLAAGFAVDMPIATTCPGNADRSFRIMAIAAGEIVIDPETPVISQAAGDSYTIRSQATFGYLPEDFSGLVESEINIDGLLRPLHPVPSRAVELIYTGRVGLSRFYKIRGNRLMLIPATNRDITIVGEYYKRPAPITKMNQIVPFYGVMDSSIQEALVRVCIAGAASITPEVYIDMEAFLVKEIDLYVQKRQRKAPSGLPGGINWM